jgi:hypothetical protein
VSTPDGPDDAPEAVAPEAVAPEADAPDSEPPVRYGRRRRAPRYGSFLATGAILGIALGVALSFARPSTGQFSENSVAGYVAATFGLVGALIGAAVAVILDRRRS